MNEIPVDKWFTTTTEISALLQTAADAIARGDFTDGIDLYLAAIEQHTRALGSTFDYEVAAARLSVGTLLTEGRAFAQALALLEEARRDWDRYTGTDRLHWLARHALFHAKALNGDGQHEDAIAESQRAFSLLRRIALGDLQTDTSARSPEITAEEVRQLVETLLARADDDDDEVFVSRREIAASLIRNCATVAFSQCALGRILSALPWLDIMDHALGRFGDPLQTVVTMETLQAYMLLELSASSVGDEAPPQLAAALDRAEQLFEEVDVPSILAGNPGAQSTEARVLHALSAARWSREDEDGQALEALLADLNGVRQPALRASVLQELASFELRNSEAEWQGAYRHAAEAVSLCASLPPDHYLPAVCELVMAQVELRRGDYHESRRWLASSFARVASAEDVEPEESRQGPFHLEPFAAHFLVLMEDSRLTGNVSAAIFFGKLSMAASQALMQRIFYSRGDNLLPPDQDDSLTPDIVRWLAADGRLGEALGLVGSKLGRNVPASFEVMAGGLLPLPPMTALESRYAGSLITLATRRGPTSASEVMALVEDATVNLATSTVHDNDPLPAVWERWDELRDDTTAFLHYRVMRTRLDVQVVLRDGAVTRSVAISSSDLAEALFGNLQALANPLEAIDPDSCVRPHALLIAPILDLLDAGNVTRLVIAGGGPIPFLPFAALYDGAHYLVERFTTTWWSPWAAPGLSQRPSLHARLALLGRSTRSDVHGLPALWSVDDELSRIAQVSSMAIAAPPMLNRGFTRDSLETSLAGDIDVVHIATHFHVDPADVSRSWFLLGEDTTLRVEELATMSAAQDGYDMVAISACSSGIPTIPHMPDAYASVEELLHRMGARSVLTARWPVVSSSSALLMESFYKGLFGKNSIDKATALQKAQLRLLQSDTVDDYRHPHYWAPFVLSGNWLPFAAKS